MKLDCSRYDPDLEMFTEPSSEPDLGRLRFLRWLSEQGRLEHPPVGPPGGDCALRLLLLGRPHQWDHHQIYGQGGGASIRAGDVRAC